MEELCRNPSEYSPALTAVLMPKHANGQHYDADAFRAKVLEHFDMSLGTGLAKLSGRVFRIGHLGDFNDLTLMGTLAGVEMGFEIAGVPYRKGGVQAAMESLASAAARHRSSAPAR